MSADSHDMKAQVLYQQFLQFENSMRYPPVGPRAYNAAPIGYCAFALTLFVYSMIMAGATVPINSSPGIAMGLALFYGGLIQFIVGIFELRIGNNFSALVFCSYGGYWFSLGALYVSGSFNFTTGIETSVQQKSLGIFYLGWTIFTLAMLIASIRTNVITIVFFFLLLLVYILWTASYFLLWDHDLSRAGGAFGILTACVLWYLGFASLLIRGNNSYFNLPVIGLEPKEGKASE